MTTHLITIKLDAEQQDALTATVAEINATGGSITAETYLAENGINAVNTRVAHYYQQALTRIGASASPMSYEQRKALIAQIESALP